MATSTTASPTTYTIDKTHSEAVFQVRHQRRDRGVGAGSEQPGRAADFH